MEEFCGSKFWDKELTWNTTNPYFTVCFEETILSTFPAVLLVLFTFVDISNILSSKVKQKDLKSTFNLLTILKTVLSLGLIVTYIVHLVRINTKLPDAVEIFGSEHLSSAAHLVGYVVVLILSIAGRYYCINSSGVQFFYWFSAAICEAILFRTAVERLGDDITEKEDIINITRIIVLPLTALQLILECVNPDWCFPGQKNGTELGKPSPDKTSTFFSKLLFFWYDSLAWTGYRRPLTQDDLWDLNPNDRSKSQVALFSKYWDSQYKKNEKKGDKSGKKPVTSILSPIIKAYGWTFLFGALLKLCADLSVFVQPEMVKALVAHVSGSDEPSWKGYLYAAVLFVTAIVTSILNATSSKRTTLIAMRIRTVLSNAVYRKALVISNDAKKESTVGEIVNLMSVDTQKFMELMPFLGTAWTAPIQIGLSIYMLHNTLGPSVFAGLGILLLLMPLNGIIATFARRFQTQQMVLKDKRIKLTNEVLSGIKVLKLYAWEPSYQDQIEAIRNEELVLMRKTAYLNSSVIFSFQCAPFLVALATFATYVLSDSSNVLNAEKTFVALSLFNIIRMPMTMLPMTIAMIIQTSVSVDRLNKFLNSEELDENAVTHDEKYEDPIVIENGTFSWTDEHTTLKDINLRIKPGELVAVVGTIGSGKTSVLSALLGDLKKHSGIVNTKGTQAYVSQGAWIQNATLRDNILFGDPYNMTKYESVLSACALKQDLEILSDGDQTEIGEKGINLSGGQKQRVALARAAYKDAEVYLFDDPLSAVDAHVGKHIFSKLIGPNGSLRKKTRVLVTHGINFLPEVDRIVVMKDGQISEVGTYKELLIKKGEFAEFLIQHLGQSDEKEFDQISLIQDLEEALGAEEFHQRRSSGGQTIGQILRRLPSQKDALEPSKVVVPVVEKTKLIEDEAAQSGNVKLSNYVDFVKSAGFTLSFIAITFNIIANVLMAYSNIWLSDWSTKATIEEIETGTANKETTNYYLIGYGGLGGGQAVAILIGSISLAIGCLQSAANLHSKALSHVLRSPMSYFDTTPLGRLVNRFSKDVETVDNVIPLTLRAVISMFLNVMSTFVVISIETPIFIAFIVPMAIFYFFLQRFYVATSRQLKRLESVSRSPIYSHFGATISGATTIRAFQLEDDFIAESDRRVDLNQKAYFPFISSGLWISIRLELIGAFIIIFTCLFALLERDSLGPGSAGLTISYALQVTSLLNFMARLMSDLESNIVSVERLTELNETPQEADWSRPKNKPADSWPEAGQVVFENYMTRYREGLDLVLKGISCTVNPGEKVGIVGRTGAGKSSMTLALFRLIEPTGGRILIDGLDIFKLGLHDLRQKITIIPQDPVLFSGTLRLNLDPSSQYSDEQIWKCLELSNLKPYVNTLPDGLQHVVEEEGQNFSIGQRQLICLSRALLRKTSILLLDEATASVDLETDDLIQKTIRKEFADSTVITIAHRLHTIMDSNRVLVLDQGEIREFDSPENLLDDKDSIFWGMAHDAKIV